MLHFFAELPNLEDMIFWGYWIFLILQAFSSSSSLMDMTGGGGTAPAGPPGSNAPPVPGAADPHALANMIQERLVASFVTLHMASIWTRWKSRIISES